MATSGTGTKPFSVPLDLLTQFKQEVRFLPILQNSRGYIMFDRQMLISVLRSENVKARRAVAESLEQLGKQRGELVIMEAPAAPMQRM